METLNREYLRSVLFGIENSLISTVGLIAGLSVGVVDNNKVVVLGASVAIVIEAVAMGVGEYLSDDAVQALDKIKRHPDNALLSGFYMMLSGSLAGLIPLSPVLVFDYPSSLFASIVAALAALFFLGYIKGKVLRTSPFKGGAKILIVGGLATGVGVVAGLIFRV